MLNKFKELIESKIAELCCSEEKARDIVLCYLPVIRELGDCHDGIVIQAERYYQAFQNNIVPDEWVNHIRRTRKKHSL